MTDLRQAAQQALEALASYSIGERLDASQVNDLIAELEAALEQQAEPPPEWPLIKNILSEYGLDAIAFVAEFKAAQQQAEPWGWYSAKADDFMTHSIRKEHERLGSHTHINGKFDLPLYTSPPKRKWQGLEIEEIKATWSQLWYDLNHGKLSAPDVEVRNNIVVFGEAVEAKLKGKNYD